MALKRGGQEENSGYKGGGVTQQIPLSFAVTAAVIMQTSLFCQNVKN